MKSIRGVFRYSLLFMVTALLLVSLLLGVALIPRDRIQATMEQSAEYLASHSGNFPYALNGIDCTKLDEYADSILLNIAYNLDDERPFESVLLSNYYSGSENSKEDFLETVSCHTQANVEYLRYWHGSIVFVRLFHLIGNIHQMYIFHAAVLLMLAVALEIMLIRRSMKKQAISLGIAMVAVNIWIVPFCLEFYWMFMLMFFSAIITLHIAYDDVQGKERKRNALFLITGITAGFLDFMTTETVTLTIPLLLILSGKNAEDGISKESNLKLIARSACFWIVGYVGMWTCKWGLATAVLQGDVRDYLTEHMEFHLGLEDKRSYWTILFDGLSRNIMCLAPQGFKTIGIYVALLIPVVGLLIPAATDRIRLKDEIDWNRIGEFALVGFIPYVRYLAIVHHMWWHYFFMYRAQIATVFAICLIIPELLESNSRKTEAGILS